MYFCSIPLNLGTHSLYVYYILHKFYYLTHCLVFQERRQPGPGRGQTPPAHRGADTRVPGLDQNLSRMGGHPRQ